jgi:hypothetical protein
LFFSPEIQVLNKNVARLNRFIGLPTQTQISPKNEKKWKLTSDGTEGYQFPLHSLHPPYYVKNPMISHDNGKGRI